MEVLSGILSYSLKLEVYFPVWLILLTFLKMSKFLIKFFHSLLNGRTLFYNRATLIIKQLFVSFFSQIVKLNFRYLVSKVWFPKFANMLHSILSTVWPEPIWVKTNSSWLLLPQHQSTYLPKRPRICINWNPPFQTSLHKIFKHCFLYSKSCFTMLTFKGTFIK